MRLATFYLLRHEIARDFATRDHDTLGMCNDVADFTLNNANLQRTALGNLTLGSLENAIFTVGASANRFTVSFWSGTGTLNGNDDDTDEILKTDGNDEVNMFNVQPSQNTE